MKGVSPGVEANLKQLAKLHGVETQYHDLNGELHYASEVSLVATLRAFGVEIETMEQCADLVRTELDRQSRQVLPQVLVAWDGTLQDVQLSGWHSTAGAEATIILEDGQSHKVLIRYAASGEAFLHLPALLPFGYHQLEFATESTTSHCLIISAPVQSYTDNTNHTRKWGLFAPLYALKSGDGWGAGSFREGKRFVEWVGKQGGSVWGLLPTLAAFLKEPCDPSPYWPVSRLFWNEFFVEPRDTPEFKHSRSAKELFESSEFQNRLAELRAGDYVDYAEVMRLKRQVLEILTKEFFEANNSKRLNAFKRYLRTNSEVESYAIFRATQEGKPDDESLVQYHKFVQFIADEQFEALSSSADKAGVSLYLDLPVGIHPSGYDAERFYNLFAWDVSVGAPPDPLGPEGQNWGFPPLKPEALRASGYKYLINLLRFHMAKAGMLRIDHVMGFYRLFCIPRGMSGKDGVYVQYPAEEMFAIVCLESHRSCCEVVGEDLGTVPDEVRSMMQRHHVRGLYILPFEVRFDSPKLLRSSQEKSVASLNTHDLIPFTGYLAGLDIPDRVNHGLLQASRIDSEIVERNRFVEAVSGQLSHDGYLPQDISNQNQALTKASHRYLAASDAEVVLINVEDLWGETEPQNRPGTVEPVPNWRHKLALSLEQIENQLDIQADLNEINNMRKKGGGDMSPKESTKSPAATKRPAKMVLASQRAPIGGTQPAFRLTDDDKYLFNEGSHLKLYEKLGSHLGEVNGEAGCHFAVWAPDAASVHVIGDFNGWNRDTHPFFPNGQSGVWEGFIAGIGATCIYKYYVRSRVNGFQAEKADPFACHSETSPKTGSIVWENGREWHDADWMKHRTTNNQQNAPISIYEMHIGSWRRVVEDGDRPLSYIEMSEQLPAYLNDLGFTHVEFMPIMEHPFNGSWGYQSTGYFAPTSRYGTPQDFMHLIDVLHQAGIGVILDWVPSHFPTDGHGLAYFDGTHLYEHADDRQGFHPDWGSLIFNFGRNEVRSFLLSSAFYWLEKFHIDGLRVDAVASMLYLDYSRKPGEWIPNIYGGRENLEAISFLRRLNEEVYSHFPDVQMFAEESTSYPMVSRPTYLGGLGFGFKWDMGWMHDTLDYFSKDPIYRRFHHSNLTFRMLYAWHENFLLPLSHDEVVHGKGSLLGRMPGDMWQKFANLRLLYLAQFTQPGKKLLFMGGELGQWAEWNHDRSLDWHLLQYTSHKGLQLLVGDLNRVYREEPALHGLDSDSTGFEWIDCDDTSNSTISFLRWSQNHEECILVVLNYTPETHFEYRVGVPVGGTWSELLNSDSAHYAGSGKGNLGEVYSTGEPVHGRPDSLCITLPPLGGVILKLKTEKSI